MNTQSDQDRLERLYQDQTPIEPPAGLDRMIRARAEQAIEEERRIKPLPLMGGLATAAVLVLAVAVVIQMPEPTPELPIGETASSPSPAPYAPTSSPMPEARERTSRELDRVSVTGSRARSTESAAAFSDQSAAEPAPPARQSMRRAEGAEDPAEEAGVELRSAPVLEAEALADELASDVDSPWLEIEEAIANGDAELAAALLERLREVFPDDDRLEEYQVRIREIESGE